MTDFLVKRFVKNYEEIDKMSVRTSYGVLSSIVGIVCNVFLFFVKFAIGTIMNSISIVADGFNNLSDAGSSILSFIGEDNSHRIVESQVGNIGSAFRSSRTFAPNFVSSESGNGHAHYHSSCKQYGKNFFHSLFSS